MRSPTLTAPPAVVRIRAQRAALLNLEFRRHVRAEGFDPDSGAFIGVSSASNTSQAQKERWFAPLLPDCFSRPEYLVPGIFEPSVAGEAA